MGKRCCVAQALLRGFRLVSTLYLHNMLGAGAALALLLAAGVGAVVPYAYPTYGEVVQRLQDLNAQYPEWVEVWTGQVSRAQGSRWATLHIRPLQAT